MISQELCEEGQLDISVDITVYSTLDLYPSMLAYHTSVLDFMSITYEVH